MHIFPRWILALAAFASAAQVGMGAVITAATLSQADVQAAINLAGPGDIVQLPAGTATWSTSGNGAVIDGIDKIVIQGAGIDQTVIIDKLGHANQFTAVFRFLNYHVGGKSLRITGLTVITDPTQYSSSTISVTSPQNFEIDHIKITQIVRRGIYVTGAQGNTDIPRGVIHDCDLSTPYDLASQMLTIQANDFNQPPSVASPTNGSWETSAGPGLGSANAVFVEDCILYQDYPNDATIETYNGGRCVVRHCQLHNFSIGAHGNDSSTRSGHTIEVYQNTIVNTYGSDQPYSINLRGGTAVMWGNEITWSGIGFQNTAPIQLQVYRAAGFNLTNGNPAVIGCADASYNGRYDFRPASSRYEKFNDSTKYLALENGVTWVLYGNGKAQFRHVALRADRVQGTYLVSGTGDVIDLDGITVRSYNNNLLNGSEPTDGNTPVANGSGTHNGPAGSTILVDTTKSWTLNQMLGRGTTALDDELFSYYVWNRTSGAGGFVLANDATTVTATLSGGSRQTWEPGDQYVITNGYPGLDQVGWAGPTQFFATYSTQVRTPVYAWNNTFNGAPDSRKFFVSWLGQYDATNSPPISDFVREGREYFNNAGPMPGYSPYTYPHPIRSGGTSVVVVPGNAKVSISVTTP